MKNAVVITYIFFAVNTMFSQENMPNKKLQNTNESSKDYESYFNDIQLGSNLYLKQDMQIREEGDYTVFEFPLLMKYNIAKKLRIIAGPKIDFYGTSKGLNTVPSVYGTLGVQYDVEENIIIEAKFNYRLTEEIPINTDYTFGSKNSLTIGSKFKF